MKKTKAPQAGSSVKRTLVPTSVDEYLANVPEPARSTLRKVRATIRSIAPAETTEVVSYKIPTFKYKGMLVAFAAFTNHCSLFALSGSVQEQFKGELKGYATSKGTIRFPVDKPLPASLLKKLVKAKIVQNEQKKRR